MVEAHTGNVKDVAKDSLGVWIPTRARALLTAVLTESGYEISKSVTDLLKVDQESIHRFEHRLFHNKMFPEFKKVLFLPDNDRTRDQHRVVETTRKRIIFDYLKATRSEYGNFY